jgi:hypothetical protein
MSGSDTSTQYGQIRALALTIHDGNEAEMAPFVNLSAAGAYTAKSDLLANELQAGGQEKGDPGLRGT